MWPIKVDHILSILGQKFGNLENEISGRVRNPRKITEKKFKTLPCIGLIGPTFECGGHGLGGCHIKYDQ